MWGKNILSNCFWKKAIHKNRVIELKAYLDLCTARENSMGKIKTWKIDVWFIKNKNINIFRENTKFWYFIVW